MNAPLQESSVFYPQMRPSYAGYLYCKDLSTTIFFPTLPESFDIERVNDFDVQTSPLFPDGLLSIYQGGQPISIPFSFSVSSHDAICANGPIDLINASKAIHAMGLPLIPDNAITGLSVSALPPASGAESSQVLSNGGLTALNAQSGTASAVGGTGLYYMPPVVNFMIFNGLSAGRVNENGTGIDMNGYLKSVRVTPHGPWLCAEGFIGRLPTSMDYSFTFVFFPGYTDNINDPSSYRPSTTTAFSVLKSFFGSASVLQDSGPVMGPTTFPPGLGPIPPSTARPFVGPTRAQQ